MGSRKIDIPHCLLKNLKIHIFQRFYNLCRYIGLITKIVVILVIWSFLSHV